MAENWSDLRRFYEDEAALRRRKSPAGRRVDLRQRFIRLLADEGRGSVLDFGAGPGGDGSAFVDAGLRYVGVDLAHGNGRLAAEAGLRVVQGSITATPVRSGWFDAGWSFSTLMHLDRANTVVALEEMVRALGPGAPLLLGLWGSEVERLHLDDMAIPGAVRPFHDRSMATNRSLIGATVDIRSEDRWESATEGADYQVFWCRTGR